MKSAQGHIYIYENYGVSRAAWRDVNMHPQGHTEWWKHTEGLWEIHTHIPELYARAPFIAFLGVDRENYEYLFIGKTYQRIHEVKRETDQDRFCITNKK